MNQQNVREFFDSWSLYDHVLDLNYMFHAEIYSDIARILNEQFPPRAYDVHDFGCGSARHLAAVLRAHPPSRYVGCDLSDVALDYARRNLTGLDCPVALHQADFFAGLNECQPGCSLLFSSFALHHLSAEEKQRFFREAFTRLRPGGSFLLVDVARQEDEDRPAYLEHYGGWVESTWKGVGSEGVDYILNHIRTSDFPETNSNLHRMASAAGFDRIFDVSAYLWHRVWRFQRAVT